MYIPKLPSPLDMKQLVLDLELLDVDALKLVELVRDLGDVSTLLCLGDPAL